MSPRTLAALLLAAALAPAARAADLNVITSVDVKDEGGAVVLSVKGTKKPSFTTFSMAEPPRFVIDFSESRFDGVPETVQVGDGVINVVKNLSYGSDASSIARVMIAFSVDVDPPDVSDVGETLVVRVAKPGGAAVAASPVDDGTARAEAAAEAERQARAEADARARAEEESRIRAEREAQARAKADAEEKARAEAQAREEREAQARAEAEERARADREFQARAKADAAREAQARAEAEEQARAEADAKARDDREARAQADADAKRRAEEAAAEKAAEAGRQEQERQAALEKAREDYDRQKAEAVASAPPAAVERPARDTARLEADAPSAHLREVGFKQLAGVSRVFVRTNVTPRFTIQELGDGVIRLELENTRVDRRNDLRFLDTSFFPSAVALVTPARQGSSYVVDIKLRQRVPYQQRIEGDVLAIDFERPAQAGAAAASSAVEEPLPAADEAPAGEAGALP